METDEQFALRLQKEFDKELEEIRVQEQGDLDYATNVAASSHSISESDESGDDSIHDVTKCSPVKKASSSDMDQKILAPDYLKLKRPLCKYRRSCYRKNPFHLNEFYHPSDFDVNEESKKTKLEYLNISKRENHLSESTSKKLFNDRLQISKPFCLFLNKTYSIKETQNDTFTLVFPDLLSPSLGTLIESVQINFMVDLNFVMSFYKASGLEKTPILFLFGQLEGSELLKEHSTITCKQVKMPFQYGVHHSKMMLFRYKEGCRIVVHTANLIEDDWTEKTQGYWVSPLFPLLGNGKATVLEGESKTRFKKDTIDYLLYYKMAEVNKWIEILKGHDFTSCNAFFIGSVPGYHTGESRLRYGHFKCRNIIQRHSGWPSSCKCPVIVQCSSIGSLGKDSKWLTGELGVSLSGGRDHSSKSAVRVIYPSEDDVRKSSQGYMGGSCLPYQSQTHFKQPWLKEHLHSWRSVTRGRTAAIPHIKTYCRFQPDYESIQYFILTSANLSKAAWGQLQKEGSQLFIRSYEAGVLLMPSQINGKDSFGTVSGSGIPEFPLHFDTPLTPYGKEDLPWLMDTRKSQPDVLGNVYP